MVEEINAGNHKKMNDTNCCKRSTSGDPGEARHVQDFLTKTFINRFAKAKAPTNPSTYRLLLLIQRMS